MPVMFQIFFRERSELGGPTLDNGLALAAADEQFLQGDLCIVTSVAQPQAANWTLAFIADFLVS